MFISENCDIVFRGYIFQDNSLLLLIMSFILFIFLISNVLIFKIIESRYKKTTKVLCCFSNNYIANSTNFLSIDEITKQSLSIVRVYCFYKIQLIFLQ